MVPTGKATKHSRYREGARVRVAVGAVCASRRPLQQACSRRCCCSAVSRETGQRRGQAVALDNRGGLRGGQVLGAPVPAVVRPFMVLGRHVRRGQLVGGRVNSSPRR